MPESHGVTFDKLTGVEFQHWYANAGSAALLGKLIQKISSEFTVRLVSSGSSMETVRQAQGALEALGTLDSWAKEIAEMNLEEETNVDDENDGNPLMADLEEAYV